MKRASFKFLAILLVVAVFFGSCKNLKKMAERSDEIEYEVNPSPLEMHGGKVAFKITTEFPEDYFIPKAIITGNPVLKYGDQEMELDPFKLQGEKVDDNNKVIPYESGGSYEYSTEFDYKDQMRRSTLGLKITASIAGKDKSVEVPVDKKLADGIVTTPELVIPGMAVDAEYGEGEFGQLMFGAAARKMDKTFGIQADIHYVIERYKVRNSELNEPDIKQFLAIIKQAVDDENRVYNGYEIFSYASPDGPERLNDNLAENRSKAAQRWLEDELEDFGVENYDDEELKSIESKQEDWEGFERLMKESDIKDKDLVLRVLKMYSDPEVREREIKNISEAFTEIADKILPRLRRSELTVNFEIKGKTDEEIIELASNNPETLEEEEILWAAEQDEDLDKKLEVYKNFAKTYPDDWRGPNNVGVVYMYKGDMDQAQSNFEKANNIEENETTLNNLGTVALAQGDIEAAEEYFTSAAAISSSAEAINYNLGVISIIKGDYDNATKYLSSSTSFNAALAQLLDDDNSAATKTINGVEKDAALVYYLKAVIGARTDNSDMVYTNLRTAVQKDSELKAYAKDDVEFHKYFEEDTFKNIVQ